MKGKQWPTFRVPNAQPQDTINVNVGGGFEAGPADAFEKHASDGNVARPDGDKQQPKQKKTGKDSAQRVRALLQLLHTHR